MTFDRSYVAVEDVAAEYVGGGGRFWLKVNEGGGGAGGIGRIGGMFNEGGTGGLGNAAGGIGDGPPNTWAGGGGGGIIPRGAPGGSIWGWFIEGGSGGIGRGGKCPIGGRCLNCGGINPGAGGGGGGRSEYAIFSGSLGPICSCSGGGGGGGGATVPAHKQINISTITNDLFHLSSCDTLDS